MFKINFSSLKPSRLWTWVLTLVALTWLLWLGLGLIPCPEPLEGFDFSTVLTDRKGQILRIALTKDQKYRLALDLDDLPEFALKYVLDYEDRWFWWHMGVNPLSMVRAAFSMLRGGRRMGGSTLTMQTVRLAYKIQTKTLLGKLKQIFWALCLERHSSKAEILKAYFNLAPYGGNVEGLAAAAQIYFHKPAKRLTKAELEALMLVPQNPILRKPATGNEILAKACKRQWYGQEEYAPLRFYELKDLPFLAPHLTTELLARKVQGPKGIVKTSLDLERQRLLEEIISRYIARQSAYGITNAAALLVHWPSLEVRALVGSANFFNTAIQGQIDGTIARRSPGSTLKPFIYALALEQGFIHPLTILADTPRSFQGYDPENFDHTFRGPIPAAEALRASRNVPALYLAGRLKNPDLYTFLRKAGVKFQAEASHYGLALVLGGAEVTMREVASLYAMLANGGVLKPLKFLPSLETPLATSLLKPETTFVTLSMLEEDSPEYEVKNRRGQTLPLRLKTGTSNGFRDAWCCGLIGPYVLVTWVGNFNNRANPLLVGGLVAKPLYQELARALAKSEDLKDTLKTPDDSLKVEKIKVCAQTGDVDLSLCEDQAETWFIPGVSPVKATNILRWIEIDTETGLRTCIPRAQGTKRVVWEFWPSDLAKMFQDAGLPKPPPPPFEEGCQPKIQGIPPRITRPKAGLTYYAPISAGSKAKMLLSAQADAESGKLSWFINGRFLATNLPGETLEWEASPGKYQIMVCDELERSQVLTVQVKLTP
ncbi:MAG: penicillin-binding protein 1C [Desulfovibrionaceae bacterium]|nr:penicillin-binding protein 1C [Desulfovibrionaceae bacterium]